MNLPTHLVTVYDAMYSHWQSQLPDRNTVSKTDDFADFGNDDDDTENYREAQGYYGENNH